MKDLKVHTTKYENGKFFTVQAIVKRHSLERLASFIGAVVGKRLTSARLTA